MPLTITVRAGPPGTPEPTLTFDAPRVVIGRSPSCDVRLPDTSVSQRHAVLSARGAEYQILDEASTNGTFVGEVRLAPRAPRTLRSGDLVRVGRVWLEVRIDQHAPTPEIALATRDLALALVQQAMKIQGQPTVPVVTVVEGADRGAELPLQDEGRVYVIGRGEGCDLSLADADASREHLQAVRRGPAVLVRDLRSRNGSLMGEQPISPARDVPWRPAWMVRVGGTVLALTEPLMEALGEAEKAADERLPDAVVPVPVPKPASAPLARLEKSVVTLPQPKSRSKFRAADAVIVASALAVIALSIAGLVWVLR